MVQQINNCNSLAFYWEKRSNLFDSSCKVISILLRKRVNHTSEFTELPFGILQMQCFMKDDDHFFKMTLYAKLVQVRELYDSHFTTYERHAVLVGCLSPLPTAVFHTPST